MRTLIDVYIWNYILKSDAAPIALMINRHCYYVFNYSSMTSNIILVPILNPFWKIKQSVMA